ncbi:MAG: hypothetical protein HYZ28_00485 [Myxococcales bacterium]|nr:hypothetical protein [Myxococcales bacterium]
MRSPGGAIGACAVCALSALALGATVEQVRTGVAVMAVDAGAVPQLLRVPLSPPVDLPRSALWFSYQVSSAEPSNGTIRGRLLPGAIEFQRASGNSRTPASIRWYVAEFDAGVWVQHGLAGVPFGDPSRTVVNIAPVDLTRTFLVVSCGSLLPSSIFNGDDYVLARLASPTTLELEINDPSLTPQASCAWQVVQYDGAKVNRGMATLGVGQLSAEVPVDPPVDAAVTVLAVYWKSDGPSDAGTGSQQLTAQLTGPDRLVVTRGLPGLRLVAGYEVISFTDGTSVRGGRSSFIPKEDAQSTFIAPLEPNRSVAFASAAQTFGAFTSGDDIIDPGAFTVGLLGPTEVRLSRETRYSSSAVVDWFVVEFPLPMDGGAVSGPRFLSTAPSLLKCGETWRYQPAVEGAYVRFELEAAPEGMTVEATTGAVEWTPSREQRGSVEATLVAVSPGGSTSQRLAFDVRCETADHRVGCGCSAVSAISLFALPPTLTRRRRLCRATCGPVS